MSRIVWDQSGERLFETGVDHGVLFPVEGTNYGKGVAWNGLTQVTESPSGAEATALYADNIKYLSLMSAEDFGATVEAYTYPDEFAECDGSAAVSKGVMIGQQNRKTFGLAYRTKVGNDQNDNLGYKIHLIYGAKASPSERSYASVNDSPEAITFSWELTTTPINVTGHKPTALITIDSTKVDAGKLKQFEDILYGIDAPEFSQTNTYSVGDHVTYQSKIYKCKSEVSVAGAWSADKWEEVTNAEARLPLPDEIIALFGTEG